MHAVRTPLGVVITPRADFAQRVRDTFAPTCTRRADHPGECSCVGSRIVGREPCRSAYVCPCVRVHERRVT